jgi:hypothetical protein
MTDNVVSIVFGVSSNRTIRAKESPNEARWAHWIGRFKTAERCMHVYQEQLGEPRSISPLAVTAASGNLFGFFAPPATIDRHSAQGVD